MHTPEKPQILIVDDRPENLTALEAILENSGVDLVRALSGNEALRLTLKREFALVLLDVQMPDMDGFETAELMRANPRTQHLPIIFITAGMKDLHYQFKGYDSGAVDYLTKPIEPLILKNKVKVFTEIFMQRREMERRETDLEALVEKRTTELLRTADSLLESREQLLHSQKMEAVGRLAGGIAHDFNNILSVIIGYSNMMQMKILPDDPLRASLDHIVTAAEKAAELTGGLLIFSRKQPIVLRTIDLNELVEKTCKLLSRVIGEDIRLDISLFPEKLMVNVDSGQIEQVLMNLATNARDALDGGGVFSITASRIVLDRSFVKAHNFGVPGVYAQLTVSDTGAGMDAVIQQRIFEPYYTTKAEGKGTGLGLSIAYGIIGQHGGHINVYSERGVGTTFRIYLPLVDSEEGAERNVLAQPPSGGSETILLAEDDEMIRHLQIEILSEFGYSIIAAADGVDAVEKYREHAKEIQLLLLDVIMPGMNGNDVLREIRKLTPGIKALFITGYTADIIENRGLVESGVDILMKPVAPMELARKVREVLDA